MIKEILILVVGFVLLVKGADWLVAGASAVARRYNVPDLIIGLTIVAFGTSAPEMVVSVIAAINKLETVSLANVIGSNNFNLFVVMGIAGLIRPLAVKSSTVWREIPFSLAAAVVLFLLANSLTKGGASMLSRVDGMILLLLFAGFLWYLFRDARGGMGLNGSIAGGTDPYGKSDSGTGPDGKSDSGTGPDGKTDISKDPEVTVGDATELHRTTGGGQNLSKTTDGKALSATSSKAPSGTGSSIADISGTEPSGNTVVTVPPKKSTWLYIAAGLAALILGGRMVVNNAVIIAGVLGMSEKIIGLTIVAGGTSLPELATSVVAAYRKNIDIAVGNVIGSNIFNILLVLGVSSVIRPLPWDVGFNTDMYVLAGGTALLFAAMFTGGRKQLDRWEAAVLTAIYARYIWFLAS